uniref:Uncharacterized protein n=1 Tax=Setaria italica TaxID=4555 RepID=K4API3_SETIT
MQNVPKSYHRLAVAFVPPKAKKVKLRRCTDSCVTALHGMPHKNTRC